MILNYQGLWELCEVSIPLAQTPCVSIVVASNKNGEETAHHANKIFTCLPYHDDPEDD